MDQPLSGESMVNSILQKANARLKFLYRKQIFFNFHTKKHLVMPLIQCHFDYTCSFWYMGISKLLKNRLQVTQNRIIKFFFKMDPKAHVWNDLPSHIKEKQSIYDFKMTVKRHFLELLQKSVVLHSICEFPILSFFYLLDFFGNPKILGH